MTDPIIVTRDKVRREWSDFEPKLIAALIAGEGAGVLITIFGPMLKNVGIDLTPELTRQFMLAAAGLIGWWTHSMGTTVTKQVSGNGQQSETHSGNPVTTITQSTPIQQPNTSSPSAPGYSNTSSSEPVSNTSSTDPNAPTQVLGGSFDRFLNGLPSAQQEDNR